jgi:hypothetical protein
VWHDEHKLVRNDPRYLSLWRPVPPAGYVAMGLVASTGGLQPPLDRVRCVRASAVSQVGVPGGGSLASACGAACLHAPRGLCLLPVEWSDIWGGGRAQRRPGAAGRMHARARYLLSAAAN